MTPEERNLLSDLFKHLREAEAQPRDPEAERFIQQMVQSQPAAPYYMAQSVLVQQQALSAAQQRIEELERQVKDAQSRAAQPSGSGGSFLSGALGRSLWGGRTEESRPAAAPTLRGPAYNPVPPPAAHSPWGAPQGGYGRSGYAPQPGFGPQGYAPRGGGFLSGAAQTAAGVAGGMLAASAISSLLSHSPGPFGEAAASGTATGETVAQPGQDQGLGQEAPNVENADYQPDDPGFDDPGFDGGGDDESWI